MGQVETCPHRAPRKRASQERSQPLGMGEVRAGRLRVSPMDRHPGIDGVGQGTRKLLPDTAGVDLRPGFGCEPRCGIPVAAVDRDHGAIDEGGGGGSLGDPGLPRGTHGRLRRWRPPDRPRSMPALRLRDTAARSVAIGHRLRRSRRQPRRPLASARRRFDTGRLGRTSTSPSRGRPARCRAACR